NIGHSIHSLNMFLCAEETSRSTYSTVWSESIGPWFIYGHRREHGRSTFVYRFSPSRPWLDYVLVSRTRRSSCALTATMTVLADMSAAQMAGESMIPQRAGVPAESEIEITLYPVAKASFWIILR